jgi:hypothetical protein
MKRFGRAVVAVLIVGGLVGMIGASPASAALLNGGFEDPDIDPSASPPPAPGPSSSTVTTASACGWVSRP